jgi:uroporphyrinogen-III synthase
MGWLNEKRVVVTRAAGQNSEFCAALTAAGAIPCELPMIRIEPAPVTEALISALEGLHQYHLVLFTSANGVRMLRRRMDDLGIGVDRLAAVRIGVIGTATSAVVEELFDRSPDVVPTHHLSEDFLAALGDVAGQSILIPTSNIARDTLLTGLCARGAAVDRVVVYYTVPAPRPDNFAEVLQSTAAVTFTSSSTVQSFAGMLLGTPFDGVTACIGSKTAETAREAGLTVDVVAEVSSVEGIVGSLDQYRSG